MSKFTTKVLGVVAALTLVVGVSVPAANALSTAELIDLLVSLGIIPADQAADAQAAVSGSDSSDSCALVSASDMTVGAQSASVTDLQNFLISGGYGIPAGATGYFGGQTQSALASYQAAMGISPAVGYFGPITRASISCVPETTTTTTTTAGDSGLSGGAGDITVSATSKYSGEEVGEGEDNVYVMAVDIEADDNSDVQIKSVKIEFYQEQTADSQKLRDYASEVSIWFDGDKVGEADVADFSETSDYYSKSIALDNVVINAGDEERLSIAVSALSNLDSGDINSDDWSVDLLSVRFVDGDGVTVTDAQDAARVDDSGTFEKDFDFASFGTANDADLTASLEDDSINDAHILDVDDSSHTDHDILSFTLEADGDSDIWVDEIPVVISVGGSTVDEAVLIVSATLFADGEDIGTEDVPTGGVVTFTDLDMTIDAGDEVEFVLEVKLQETDGALVDADTIQATLTVASIDAEDEVGDSVTADGAAAGDTHAVYDKGFNLAFLSSTSEVIFTSETSATGDRGKFVIKYEITATDGDIYIDNTCVEDNDGSEVSTATSYSVTNDGSNTTDCVLTATAAGDSGTSFLVENGASETFTLTVNVEASADAFAQVKLEAIGWASVTGGDANVFDFSLPEMFETDPIHLNLF